MNWIKTVMSGIRRKHRDRKAPASYRVMTPWEAERMFGNQSYRWRYRLNGGRHV